MTECSRATDPTFRLVPGARVGLLDGALIARRAEHTIRLAHGSAGLLTKVAHELGHRGTFRSSERDERRLLEMLAERGIVAPATRCLTLFDPETLLEALPVEVVHRPRTPMEATCPQSDWIGVARAGAPERVAELVDVARQQGRSCWVLQLSGDEAMLSREHPDERGCPRCAVIFDRRALDRFGSRGLVLSDPPGASACALGRALLIARIEPTADPWKAGTAQIAATTGPSLRREPIPIHPHCPCARRARRLGASDDASTPDPHRLWTVLCGRRLAPIWPIEATRDAETVRVAFTRSREPSRINSATVGMALASGPHAEARALSEAVERFAMLHGAPDLTDVSAAGLGRRALTWSSITRLLPPDEAYVQAGFRHARPTPALALDWLEVVRHDGRSRRYVPASVVGCVRRGTARIVDPTSSGWAAYHQRDGARARALLELIERDALLRFWHARTPAPRLTDRGGDDVMLLRIQPCIPLAVVLALACTSDGSLRTGSGASLVLEDAVAHALAELALARSSESVGRGENATLVTAAATPEDHRAYWSGARGRALFDEIAERVAPSAPEEPVAKAVVPEPSLLRALTTHLRSRGLTPWFAERQFPDELPGRIAVRALVPGLVELSFGAHYARTRAIAEPVVERRPHPFA
ncbi:MAG: hypothetical protein CNCCGFBP_01573 [Fimbriimonadaceae bacterium]|nr:hypothetical protein [Fimbriimonadaceae bacterium]